MITQIHLVLDSIPRSFGTRNIDSGVRTSHLAGSTHNISSGNHFGGIYNLLELREAPMLLFRVCECCDSRHNRNLLHMFRLP
jgi:hypothetical protein